MEALVRFDTICRQLLRFLAGIPQCIHCNAPIAAVT